MHKKLFIPGPVDVLEEVLLKLATPQIGHRSKEATELQKRISENMQKLMFTENVILLSTSSGSGLMEASIRSCTRKRVAVFSVGSFGDRWYKMATTNNVPADKFTSEPGNPTTPEMVDEVLSTGKYDVITVTHNETSSGIMNPTYEIGTLLKEKYPDVLFLVDAVSSLGGAKIEVDKSNIDICITSTQKCLGLPAGLAICSVSKRAYEAAKEVSNRGLYFDIVSLYDLVVEKYQYPSTPSLPHMFALDYQLDRILNKQGLENRFAKHTEMANVVREWAKKYFGLYVNEEKYTSNTVTAILKVRKDTGEKIDFKELNKALGEKGFTISDGYGTAKEATFRIAHMADATMEDLKTLLGLIEGILGLK